MKKILYTFLLLFTFISGYSQFPESFEGSTTTLPLGWNYYQTNTGPLGNNQFWKVITVPAFLCDSGPENLVTATIDREQIGDGNTSLDYLSSPQFTVPVNGQVTFTSKQFVSGDNGSIYKLLISTNSDQSNLGAYVTLKTWTELEMNAVFNVCELKRVDIPAQYVGQQVYIAFVKENTQNGIAPDGDRWNIDKINVVQKCLDPGTGSSNQGVTTHSINWSDATGSKWDVAYRISSTDPFDENPTIEDIVVGNPNLTGSAGAGYVFNLGVAPLLPLEPGTIYQYWVRSDCTTATSGENTSNWIGPKIFITLPFGTTCSEGISITNLPYQNVTNSGLFSDFFDTAQATGCGATPAGTNYREGNDVFYNFTAPQDGLISIKLTPTGPNSSIFVYAECPTTGPCLAGVANTNGNVRQITNFAVTAGEDYYIIVSSSATTQVVGHTIVLQYENCTAPVGIIPAATDITESQAILNWTDSTGATSWEISVQDLGAGLPPTNVQTVTGGLPTYTATSLLAGHQYEYWVRSECSPGVYSSWSGPYPFNTKGCAPVNACTYTFRMTDSANNGWQGARMQVRQSGIVLQEIGSTYTAGAGPVDVQVQLCHNVPFDLFWSVAGSAPQQCRVAIINSFGQTIYTKAPGVGGQGFQVYSDVVDCVTPRCDIAPINVSIVAGSITTNSATVQWEAPSTSSWDIYIVEAGNPAPTSTSTPTYNDIVAGGTNPIFNFTLPNTLTPDTTYNVYVRVNCLPEDSTWSTPACVFTTIPTCPKPITPLTVTGISTTSATFGWTNATPASDSSWDILLVTSDTVTPPAILPPASAPYSSNPYIFYNVTGLNTTSSTYNSLDPAQIYFYYVRTRCSDDNVSTWSGPFVFNTVTCEPVNKCNYKFLLTNTAGNSWNGGRMQVLQNGILIQTLGSGSINNAAGVTVALCPNEAVQLFWSIAGTVPENIGITIISPFNDIIYTKPAGTGTPLTMLYNQLGNCTPPTCPKPLPVAVDVATIGSTSAELTWTEQGTATQWEVFVTPFGSAPPVNGSAITATSSAPTQVGNSFYYLAGTPLPFTVTGLTAGTAYQYYVRAICSSTDISTWTILNPIRFVTKPINDECLGAIEVPINPDRNCTQFALGNTLGATRSLPNTAPVCPGNTDDDVWYTFQATSVTHIIKINNIVGSTTDINHTLYSGNDCGALTQLYCSNPDTSVAANLIVGNIYKIRVYTNGGNANQTATFEVCITTPPPVTNDNCETAIVAQVNNGLLCTLTTSGSLTGATASNQGVATCAGTEDDDIWFSFVSNSTTQVIDLLNIQGTVTDLNHAVYSGACPNLTLLYCSDPDQSLNANFVVGQTYYVRVWSASSTLQDITFDLCIGRILPPITTSTAQYTKQQLIEDILLNTTCANVSNITFSTGTNFTGITANGIGYFNKGESEFPFEDGIILSTGNVNSAPGPNDSTLSDGDEDGLFPPTWLGDDELETIILEGTGTEMISHNATKLEFDFTPLANQISFNYLFASEEYGDFQCNFSDSFAFILTDLTTGISTNLAVIPNTTTPVSVITIRDQAYNDFCDSVNPEYFGGYYGDGGINPIGAPIDYDGFTVPLTAFSPVTAGNPYHIKLVIADRGDAGWDSAVFLQGDSFSIGNIELGNDFLEASGNAICPGDSIEIDSGLNPSVYNFTWYLGTDVIPNETESTLTVTQAGVYTLSAQYGVSSCIQTDSVTVEFFQDATAGTAENLIDCNPTGTSTFDLTVNEASIMNPFVAGTHTINYYTSLTDADTNNLANAITTPSSFTNTTNPQTIYVRVSKTGTSCYQIVQFTLTVQDLTPQFTFSGDTTICPQETTTISVVPTDNNFDISLVTYQWQYLGVDIAAETNNSITISGANYGMYSCTVNNTGCEATQNVEITNSNTVWDLAVDAPPTLCPDENGTITSTVNNNPTGLPEVYTYTLPDLSTSPVTTNVLPIDAPGDYIIKVSILGCESTQTVTVGQSNTVWDLAVDAPPTLCPDENGTITSTVNNNPTGLPEVYTYTLPDLSTSPVTTNVLPIDAPGDYIIKVSILGCESTQTVTVGQSNTVWDLAVDAPPTLCPDENGTITSTVTNNPTGLPEVYTYTLPDLSTSPVTTNVLPIDAPGDYIIKVSILGCESTQTVTVGQSNTVWDLAVDAPPTLCPDENGTITSTVNNNPTGLPEVYTYTLPDLSTSPVTTNVLPIDAPGDYIIKVSILGCESTQTVTVGQSNTVWDLAVDAPPTLCPDENGTITSTVNNNPTGLPEVYTYTLPDLSTSPVTTNVLPIDAPGDYIIKVSILGCESTQTVTVGQSNTVWDLAVDAPPTLCPDENGTITSTVNNNPTGLPEVYTYTLPDLSTSPVTTNVLPIDAPGDYIIKVSILGCESTQTVTVGQSNTVWDLAVDAPPTLCPDENGTITSTVNNNPTGLPEVYTYTLPDLSTSPVTTNVLPIDAPGDYIIKVSILGCESTQTVTVGQSNTVWDLVVSGSDKLCPNETGTITSSVTNIPSNMTATYTYTLPNGTVSSDTDDSLSISDEGIYTIMVNILGCTSTTTFTVLSNDDEFEIEPQSGCNTGNYVIKVLPKNNSFDISTSTFQWTDPKGTIISIESSCNATIPGEYTCIITDVYGCSTTFSQQFSSISCGIQQGISPIGVGPGDGLNDSFDLSSFNVSKLEIFNRYGSKVYTKDNYTNEWFGQSDSGNELPDGTYYYVIEIVNDDPKTGWIYINREQ